MPPPLFEVVDLSIAVFDADRRSKRPAERDTGLPEGWTVVVHDVSFTVEAGETLALVGESASGKSLMLLGSLGLLPAGARVVGGTARLEGVAVPFDENRIPQPGARRRRRLRRDEDVQAAWRHTIGTRVGVMFQDPVAAWDPTVLIGHQSGEVLEEHHGLTPQEVQRRVLDALGEVRLPKEHKFLSFVREMSRGEAQRAMLAAALLADPGLLLADEPLTGLDPPAARAILSLMEDMRRRRGMGMVLVTHDLAVVASVADRVGVVYGGRIIEEGPVRSIFHRPRHPYTSGLLGSIPWPGSGRLRPIEGDPPDLVDLPAGCAFADRCPHALASCRTAVPPLRPIGDATVSCWRADELELDGISRR